ncbi:MFS transporter [Brevibacillus parabrevis]|uniref:MFS transporter n=1 Tax=Brevibacillus parabrevis TaxID=54914 RepID=UPI00238008C9|nr:MFS transporter [Brevibacillus parabrevis]MED2258419.1 MFS transporter [Brevibacillus parabrevis]WDV94376.1 MFS transporter [Brevibacillus parabrevis]
MNKPYLAFLIAFGIFGIINTELGVVGILPQISEHYQISASQAGLLVSSFALIIAIFGPVMTLFFSGLDRKNIMAVVLVVFAISNLICAFAPNYVALLLFRIAPAFLHPVYFSVAFAAAASSVPKEQSAQAVAKVFAGVSAGMVLGIPVISFMAEQFSLEVSFLFSASLNALAAGCIFCWVPSMPATEKLSFRAQLGVLRKPPLWFNIATACFILAALFAVYSYFAEYLAQVTTMDRKVISAMLILFGISAVLGNLQAGKLLSKSVTKTTFFYPIILAMIYLLLFFAGTYTIPTIMLIILWGAVFASGLIISQTWLTSEATKAPEFGNSLFVSFGNLGVAIGSASGGWFLSELGTHHIVWSGVLFLTLAFLCIVLKIKIFDRHNLFAKA